MTNVLLQFRIVIVGRLCVAGDRVCGNSVTSGQFYCESEISLKNSLFFKTSH